MSARRRPIDDLPIYATDNELAGAILGDRASEWAGIVKIYERRGMPKFNVIFGGRYVPAVKRFLDILEGVDTSSQIPAQDGPDRSHEWNNRKNTGRASNGGRALAG